MSFVLGPMIGVDVFTCFGHTIKHIFTIDALEYFLSNTVFVHLNTCEVARDQVVILPMIVQSPSPWDFFWGVIFAY